MHDSTAALVRVVIIVLVLAYAIINSIVRANRAASKPGPARKPSLGDLLRNTMTTPAEQARMRQSQMPAEPLAFRLNEKLNQPPSIQPESSIFPSLLLLALVVSLGLLAYRFFAG